MLIIGGLRGLFILVNIGRGIYTEWLWFSGLGLATAYSIINNHGGYITAESTQNVGTTFHIYLPVFKKLTPVKKKPAREKPVRGKGRILVMDDEEIIRELLHGELTEIGYEAELAKDGAEAIELYRKGKESGQPFESFHRPLRTAFLDKTDYGVDDKYS